MELKNAQGIVYWGSKQRSLAEYMGFVQTISLQDWPIWQLESESKGNA